MGGSLVPKFLKTVDFQGCYSVKHFLHSSEAKSFFLDDAKIPDKRLQDKIAKVADYAEDTDVIMFDISAKSASDSKSSKEVIKDIFMKVFNDHLGYCGSIPFLAEFERTLDDFGQYETFKRKFCEINGSSWESQREDYYFIQDDAPNLKLWSGGSRCLKRWGSPLIGERSFLISSPAA